MISPGGWSPQHVWNGDERGGLPRSPVSRSNGEWRLGLWLIISACALVVGGALAHVAFFPVLGALSGLFGLFVVWFERPFVGLVLLALASPFTFLSRQLLGSLLPVGFGLFQAVALVGLVAWIVALASGRTRLRDRYFVLVSCAVLVVLSASLLASHFDGDLVDGGFSVRHLISLAGLVAAAILFAEFVASRSAVTRLAWALALALAGGAILNLLAVFVPSLGVTDVDPLGTGDRLTGLVGFANAAGFLAAVALILLISLPARRRFVRLVGSVLLLPPVVAALLTSGSRSSLLGCAGGMLLLAFGRFPRRRVTIAVGIVLSAAVVWAISTIHAEPLERLHIARSLGDLRSGDLRRIEQYQITGKILERRPILGVGWGNYQFVADRFLPAGVRVAPELPPHSGLLQMTAEGGVLGLLVYISLFALVYSRASCGMRGLGRHDAAHGIVAALIVFAVFQLFQPGLSQEAGWVLVGLTAALPRVGQTVQVSTHDA